MSKNRNIVFLGILTATVAAILFAGCANATGGYSTNWRPYAVALIVLGLYWVWLERRHRIDHKRRVLQLKGLTDHINFYLGIPVTMDSKSSPYINERIIPISRFSDEPQLVKPRSIHQDIYWDLSEELRATGDEQIGTIVWIDLLKQSTRIEDPFQIIRHCRITIIDRTRAMIVGATTLEITDSRYKMPAVTEFGMAVEGPALGWYRQLCDETLNYLEKLPRQRART